MNVALEITGYNRERAMRQMRTIYHHLARIYEIAERDGIPTYKAADRMAEERSVVMGKPKLPLGRTTPRSRAASAAASKLRRNARWTTGPARPVVFCRHRTTNRSLQGPFTPG